MVSNQAEARNGKRWQMPSRLAGILFTDQGLCFTEDFVSSNDLLNCRHVRVFFRISRSRTEFWFQFQQRVGANTVALYHDVDGRGGMLVKAPGLLADTMSHLEGEHHYKLSNRAHATVFVISLEQSH